MGFKACEIRHLPVCVVHLIYFPRISNSNTLVNLALFQVETNLSELLIRPDDFLSDYANGKNLNCIEHRHDTNCLFIKLSLFKKNLFFTSIGFELKKPANGIIGPYTFCSDENPVRLRDKISKMSSLHTFSKKPAFYSKAFARCLSNATTEICFSCSAYLKYFQRALCAAEATTEIFSTAYTSRSQATNSFYLAPPSRIYANFTSRQGNVTDSYNVLSTFFYKALKACFIIGHFLTPFSSPSDGRNGVGCH